MKGEREMAPLLGKGPALRVTSGIPAITDRDADRRDGGREGVEGE